MASVIITAGFDKAKNAIAIAELLSRQSADIKGIIVVNPFNLKRLQSYLRQRGRSFLFQALKRLSGQDKKPFHDAVLELFKREAISYNSLKTWAQDHNVAYHLINSLNSSECLGILANQAPDWVVYGGGGILRKKFIEATKGRILNAHAGPLPEVRGMNAVEWSLLLGYPPHITVHLIDRGIDTGGIIKQYPIPVFPQDDIESLRSRSTAIGIEALCQTVLEAPAQLPKGIKPVSRQCYVLAPALKELLEKRLEHGLIPLNKVDANEPPLEKI